MDDSMIKAAIKGELPQLAFCQNIRQPLLTPAFISSWLLNLVGLVLALVRYLKITTLKTAERGVGMKLLRSALLVLLIQQEAFAIIQLKKVIEIANFWISSINSVQFLVGVLQPPDKMPQEILNSVHEISAQLDRVGIQLNQKLDTLAISIPKQVRDESRLDRAVEDVVANIRDINYLYRTYFVNIFNATISNHTIQAFISKAISIDSDSPRKSVENIYSHFLAAETRVIRDSLLDTFIRILESQERTRCDEFQSPKQWLYEVYSLIAAVELRSLIMVTSAYKIRSSTTGENHEMDILSTKEQYVNRMHDYMVLMKGAFNLVPNDIRRCDPPSQVKGSTYIEMEKYAQTVIINADQLSTGASCQACESFRDITLTTLRNTLFGEKFGSSCNGLLKSCTTWSSKRYWWPRAHKVEVCKMPRSSSRRYLYFADPEGRVSGKKSSCPGDVIRDFPFHLCPLDRREYFPPGCQNNQCNHCLCTCLQSSVSSPEVPSFDIDQQRSECSSNMVVTGVKLVKDNDNVIRIQINQGKLTAGARILAGSEHWVPLRKAVHTSSLTANRNGIILNSAVTPENSTYVITGVQFIAKPFNGREALTLKIYANSFDASSGDIDCSDSKTYTSDVGDIKSGGVLSFWRLLVGINLDISNSYSPLDSTLNLPDNANKKFVQFQPSGVEKDAGQTVVPFVDVQPVYTNPPSPLSGIGFYHKGAKGFGGYVALKILTLNMGNLIDTQTD